MFGPAMSIGAFDPELDAALRTSAAARKSTSS